MASNTYINMKHLARSTRGKTEKIVTSATHAESVNATPTAGEVEVYTDATNGVYVTFAAAPNVATAVNKMYVPTKWLTSFNVEKGMKVSVVEA